MAGAPVHTHDSFISHASEDKETVARPLAAALVERGWSTWLDELEMTIGDSLSRRIDEALLASRFGVVILSPSFFAKQWPQRELAGLVAREAQSGTKVILPVWHRVDRDDILGYSPVLADRLGASTAEGVDVVANRLSDALEKELGPRDVGRPPRRFELTGAQVPHLIEGRIHVADAFEPIPGATAEGLVETVVKDESDPIGRNDPCWCGSGKKYKRCHGA